LFLNIFFQGSLIPTIWSLNSNKLKHLFLNICSGCTPGNFHCFNTDISYPYIYKPKIIAVACRHGLDSLASHMTNSGNSNQAQFAFSLTIHTCKCWLGDTGRTDNRRVNGLHLKDRTRETHPESKQKTNTYSTFYL
jgi:hypothetical protein